MLWILKGLFFCYFVDKGVGNFVNEGKNTKNTPGLE